MKCHSFEWFQLEIEQLKKIIRAFNKQQWMKSDGKDKHNEMKYIKEHMKWTEIERQWIVIICIISKNVIFQMWYVIEGKRNLLFTKFYFYRNANFFNQLVANSNSKFISMILDSPQIFGKLSNIYSLIYLSTFNLFYRKWLVFMMISTTHTSWVNQNNC